MPKKKENELMEPIIVDKNHVIRGISELRSARYGPMMTEFRRFLSESKPFAMENGQLRTATEIAERLHIGDLRQLTDDLKPSGFASFFTVVKTTIYPDTSFSVDTALFLDADSADYLFKDLSIELERQQKEDSVPLKAHWLAEYTLEDSKNPDSDVIVRLEMAIWSLSYKELADPVAIFVVRMSPGDPKELLLRPADCCRRDRYDDFLWNSGFAVAYAGLDVKTDEVMEYGMPIEVPFSLSEGEDRFAGEDCPGVYCSFSVPKRTITEKEELECYRKLRGLGLRRFKELVGRKKEKFLGQKDVDGVLLDEYMVPVTINDETEPVYIFKSFDEVKGYTFCTYG